MFRTIQPGSTPLNVSTSHDTWTLAKGEVMSSMGIAIYETVFAYGNTFNIDGWVFNDGKTTAFTSSGTNTTINVGQTGVIDGWHGLSVGGDNNVVNNAGRIEANDFPAYRSFGNSSTLNNSGLITSSPGKLAVETVAGDTFHLHNSGKIVGGVQIDATTATLELDVTSKIKGWLTIKGEAGDTSEVINYGAIDLKPWGANIKAAVEFGGGSDTFINAGAVWGNVYLGDGDDGYSGGTGAVLYGTIFAGGGKDWVIAGSEDNVIDGGTDADSMYGGKGNDTYVVDNVGDVVSEEAGLAAGSADVVRSSVSYTLGYGVAVERLEVYDKGSTAAQNLAGNEFGQALVGGAGANKLYGRLGADTLTGNLGNDVFVFDSKLGSGNVDHITDFANANGNNDIFRLEDGIFAGVKNLGATLDPAQFLSKTSDMAYGADDRIIYNSDTGRLYYDADGYGGTTAAVLVAIIDNHASLTGANALTAADFYVI